MPDSATDLIQFSKEMLPESEYERYTGWEGSYVWKKAVQTERFAQISNNPAEFGDIFKASTSRVPELIDNLPDTISNLTGGMVNYSGESEAISRIAKESLTEHQANFVTQVENLYYENRGNIDIDWFMQFSPNDLMLLESDVLDLEPINEILLKRAEEQAQYVIDQSEIDKRTKVRVEQMMNGRSLFGNIYTGFAAIADIAMNPELMTGTGGLSLENFEGRTDTLAYKTLQKEPIDEDKIRQEEEYKFYDQADRIYDEEIAEYIAEDRAILTEERGGDVTGMDWYLKEKEAAIRSQLREGVPAGEVLESYGSFRKYVNFNLSLVGDLTVTALDLTMGAIEETAAGSDIINYLKEEQQANIQKQIAALAEDPLIENPSFLREASRRDLNQMFEAMPQENPDIYNMYIRQAGMDPRLAFEFFQADVMEAPEAQEQMQAYYEAAEQQQQQVLTSLEDQQFRPSHAVLNTLAMYGRNVPMRLATGFAVLLTDDDVHSDLTTGMFMDAWDEIGNKIEQANFSPAQHLGIDGSLAGLTLDLVGGIAFDPATWLFGPRLAGGQGVRTSTFKTASRLANSKYIAARADDVVRFFNSPSRGSSAMYHQMSWLDDIGKAELYQALNGGRPRTIFGNWSSSRYGTEIGFDVIERVVPLTDDVGAVGVAGPRALDAYEVGSRTTREALEAGTLNMDSPITFFIDKKTGNLILDAEEAGILNALRTFDNGSVGMAPIEFKILKKGDVRNPVTMRGKTGDVYGSTAYDTVKIERQTDNLSGGYNEEYLFHGREVPTGEPQITHGGLSFSEGMALGYAKEGGEVLVFRRSDLPRNLRRYLDETGEDIEQIIQKGTREEQIQSIRAEAAAQWPDDPVRQARYSEELIAEIIEVQDTLRAVDIIPSQAFDDMTEAGELSVRIGKSAEGTDLMRNTDRLLAAAKEGDGFRADQLFGKSTVYGELPTAEVRRVMKDSILRGATPHGAEATAVSLAQMTKLRQALRKLPMGKWIERYATPQNMISRFELSGSTSMNRVYEAALRMWGDDTAKSDLYIQRLMEVQRKAQQEVSVQAARAEVLQPMLKEIQLLMDHSGGSWDDFARLAAGKELVPSKTTPWTAEQTAAQKALIQKIRQVEKKSGALDRQGMRMVSNDELINILDDMYDDFNRTRIATNRYWKELKDPETGMVPWDQIQKGLPGPAGTAKEVRKFFADDMTKLAKELKIEGAPDDIIMQINEVLNQPMAYNAPASVLDLTIASEMGGAAYTRATHHVAVAKIRDTAWTLQKFWVVDKVFSAATAVRVSFDELLRIWHLGGASSVNRWMRDRAMFMRARAHSTLRHPLENRLGLSKNAPSRGVQYLSDKAQYRMQKLQDYPTYLKQAERQYFDGQGTGWVDIAPNDPHYIEAARRWTGNLLGDSGFRAYLRGPDAFQEWFFSPDGARLRGATAMAKDETGTVVNKSITAAQDAYEGWNTVFDRLILHEARGNGMYDDVLRAFKESAEHMDASGRPMDLPDFVYNNLGSVRGVQKTGPQTGAIDHMSEAFFDRFFMDPVNHRRGFLAEMSRQQETARLESLFATQGKRVVSDLEVENMLNMQGIAGDVRTGLKGYVQEQAAKRGLILQSTFDDMVEQTVARELDNVLFTWDQGSRMGSQARAVFPFGRPWADMMGYWGREIMRKPHLRGWVNDTNFLGMRSLAEQSVIPTVNPKPLAMMSRFAATDFTVDRGFFGEKEGGLLPGSEKTNLGSLFFIPTGGDNPFGLLLPGLGFIPIVFLDWLFERNYDPVEQPLEYQQALSTISDFLPTMGYQQGGAASRALGGGLSSTVASLGIDLVGGTTGVPFYGLTSDLGDISREVDRGRQMSALLADPEIYNELLNLPDGDSVDQFLRALQLDADKNASASHGVEKAMRWLVPMSAQYPSGLDDIMDVWLDTGQEFPELTGNKDIEWGNLDEDQERQIANDIRSNFFAMDEWEKNLYVYQNPAIAVNAVSSWEWTEKAISRNLEGTDQPYRTSATTSALALHNNLINNNLIRPVQPVERAKLILGYIQNAKESAAKDIYERTAVRINDYMWENVVTPESKAYLEGVLEHSDFGERWGINDAREFWQAWGSFESDLESFVARLKGIDEDSEEYEALRSNIRIDEDQQAWGAGWPGINDANLAKRFQELKINSFTPEVAEIASVLGIDLTPGMTGLQLFTEVQSILSETQDSPVFSTVRAAYDGYTKGRSVASEAARMQLSTQAHNPSLDEEWKQGMDEFLTFAQRESEHWRDVVGGAPQSAQREVAEQYMALWHTADDVTLDWEKIWEDRYERTFGPMEWEEPVPAAPFLEDGGVNGNAYAPFIMDIPDGDTLYVKTRQGQEQTHAVRLLGIRARDYGLDDTGADADKDRLVDALEQAMAEGATIWLVRDPELFGNTDKYGRELAWLWIGEEPFYFPEDLHPNQEPSESDR